MSRAGKITHGGEAERIRVKFGVYTIDAHGLGAHLRPSDPLSHRTPGTRGTCGSAVDIQFALARFPRVAT